MGEAKEAIDMVGRGDKQVSINLRNGTWAEAKKRAIDLRMSLKDYIHCLIQEDLRKPLERSAASIPGEIKEE